MGDKFDGGKLRMDLLPPEAIEGMAEVLTFGAKKYAPNNWKTLPDFDERYTAALLRHMFARMRGERDDPESGLSHLKHIITNAAFLIWKEEMDRAKENLPVVDVRAP